LDPLTERNFANALDLITAIKVTLREEHAIWPFDGKPT
jgi:hypothetical protein